MNEYTFLIVVVIVIAFIIIQMYCAIIRHAISALEQEEEKSKRLQAALNRLDHVSVVGDGPPEMFYPGKIHENPKPDN